MEKNIIYESSTYGIITLNRAQKRNAISTAMANELNLLLDELKKEPPKFLVIKSAGDRVFCAGGDLTELHGDLNEVEAFKQLTPMRTFLYKLATFPTLTICLLQGNALGGGCELATACDIRIAKQNTKFGFIQSNLGILPGWGGGALLYRKVQPSFALQWITEGAVYDSEFLLEKGWLHHIVSGDEWSDEREVLGAYKTKSIEQLMFLKEQFVEAVNYTELEEEMEIESKKSAQLWPSEEHKCAVNKFLNK